MHRMCAAPISISVPVLAGSWPKDSIEFRRILLKWAQWLATRHVIISTGISNRTPIEEVRLVTYPGRGEKKIDLFLVRPAFHGQESPVRFTRRHGYGHPSGSERDEDWVLTLCLGKETLYFHQHHFEHGGERLDEVMGPLIAEIGTLLFGKPPDGFA